MPMFTDSLRETLLGRLVWAALGAVLGGVVWVFFSSTSHDGEMLMNGVAIAVLVGAGICAVGGRVAVRGLWKLVNWMGPG